MVLLLHVETSIRREIIGMKCLSNNRKSSSGPSRRQGVKLGRSRTRNPELFPLQLQNISHTAAGRFPQNRVWNPSCPRTRPQHGRFYLHSIIQTTWNRGVTRVQCANVVVEAVEVMEVMEVQSGAVIESNEAGNGAG